MATTHSSSKHELVRQPQKRYICSNQESSHFFYIAQITENFFNIVKLVFIALMPVHECQT